MRIVLLLLLIGLLPATELWAQGCVTCTNTAANLNQNSAIGLNNGIMYLAAIPLLLIASVGYIWYRRNHSAEEPEN